MGLHLRLSHTRDKKKIKKVTSESMIGNSLASVVEDGKDEDLTYPSAMFTDPAEEICAEELLGPPQDIFH